MQYGTFCSQKDQSNQCLYQFVTKYNHTPRAVLHALFPNANFPECLLCAINVSHFLFVLNFVFSGSNNDLGYWVSVEGQDNNCDINLASFGGPHFLISTFVNSDMFKFSP